MVVVSLTAVAMGSSQEEEEVEEEGEVGCCFISLERAVGGGGIAMVEGRSMDVEDEDEKKRR